MDFVLWVFPGCWSVPAWNHPHCLLLPCSTNANSSVSFTSLIRFNGTVCKVKLTKTSHSTSQPFCFQAFKPIVVSILGAESRETKTLMRIRLGKVKCTDTNLRSRAVMLSGCDEPKDFLLLWIQAHGRHGKRRTGGAGQRRKCRAILQTWVKKH